jgi:hypothetical protein
MWTDWTDRSVPLIETQEAYYDPQKLWPAVSLKRRRAILG